MSDARDPVHLDRMRAEAFGSVAEQYDRFRPSYPDALFADLERTGARRVLDIGCGTGKASTELMARGLSVLGVEVDPEMAAVARSHGLDVEVAAFEDWMSQDRTFDLVTCAQAWHWIDPVRGAHKTASVLGPNGVLACFWNHDKVHSLSDELAEVYRRLAPDCAPRALGSGLDEDEPYAADLRNTRVFSEVAVRRYDWSQTLTAAEWVGRISTQSDHIRLPEEVRTELLREVHALVTVHEPVKLSMGTYAIFATV